MPTFFNSTADAAEAFESLRGLAHASRTFDQPAQMYGVVGDLSSGMRSPRQVLEQLVGVHEQKVAHTFNESGDHIAGVRDAMANGGTSRKVSIGYLNVTKRDGFGRETRIVGPDPERATLVKWAVRACATGALDYPADAVQPVLHGQHLLAGRDPRRHPRTARRHQNLVQSSAGAHRAPDLRGEDPGSPPLPQAQRVLRRVWVAST
ncbi:hypothetical protein [Serinibacter salmoneus]|uniref:hypothetical protein n=1 Tax=Serinibacter salmoneus TaxID=556530 RepID=UPI001FE9F88C|nr:hypothetical protein [Serinibacter salmoneus]